MTPENKFYSKWDCESLGERSLPEREYRNAFEIDRDRIIHSTAFRRLQSKTQVYVTGQSDQYRTRLTHSIEVAQIGRSIVNYLNRCSDQLSQDFFVDSALVEAACLAHDLGNPPIGHKGESRLNDLMDPWGGFEGNAQSLRILTEIVRGDQRPFSNAGMEPTRACLDAILKYKILGKENSPRRAKFLYPEQQDILTWVHGDESVDALAQSGAKIRSIECDIMDLSDDIAYTTSDLFDGYKQALLTSEQVDAFWEDHHPDVSGRLRKELDEVLKGHYPMSRFVAGLIGRWLYAITLKEQSTVHLDSNRYRFTIELGSEANAELQALRHLNYDLIYDSDFVKIPETAGVQILEELFVYYRDVVLGNREVHPGLPLPAGVEHRNSQTGRMRVVCDWVSGMTDHYALNLHNHLTE